jgi:hypothetical protein
MKHKSTIALIVGAGMLLLTMVCTGVMAIVSGGDVVSGVASDVVLNVVLLVKYGLTIFGTIFCFVGLVIAIKKNETTNAIIAGAIMTLLSPMACVMGGVLFLGIMGTKTEAEAHTMLYISGALIILSVIFLIAGLVAIVRGAYVKFSSKPVEPDTKAPIESK